MFKEIVKLPTRGANTLDLVLTNLQDFYDVPDRLPPFGLSDHMSIQIKPKLHANLPEGHFVVKSRDLHLYNKKRSILVSHHGSIQP